MLPKKKNYLRPFLIIWKIARIPLIHFGKLIKANQTMCKPSHSDMTVNILVYIFIQDFCYVCSFAWLKFMWAFFFLLYGFVFCFSQWTLYHKRFPITSSFYKPCFFLSQVGFVAVFPVPKVHSFIQWTFAACLLWTRACASIAELSQTWWSWSGGAGISSQGCACALRGTASLVSLTVAQKTVDALEAADCLPAES